MRSPTERCSTQLSQMQPSMWREKCFYLAYFSAQVAIGPFLPLFYDRKGFSKSQIGVLAAARPWISAPSAFVWSAIADHHSVHKLVLLLTFISATLLTSALYFASSYSILLLLVVSGQLLAAPTTVIADAATVAKCGQVSLLLLLVPLRCAIVHVYDCRPSISPCQVRVALWTSRAWPCLGRHLGHVWPSAWHMAHNYARHTRYLIRLHKTNLLTYHTGLT